MGATAKILIFLCAIPTLRTHTHGIRLIIILALAYLLQMGQKKGNKKPKSLWKRSMDDMTTSVDEDLTLEPTYISLQYALDLDMNECAQHALCRLGLRQARGEKQSENESLLLHIIFRNKSKHPRSRGEQAFQAAVEYGHRTQGDEKLCYLRYHKCPEPAVLLDSFLKKGDIRVT